jgi:hypothetical protein
MPTLYKRLGNSAPSATTYTQLYQVPASTAAIISSLVITNRGTTAATYRIVQVDSATAITSPGNADFVAYDVAVQANDSTALTLGMTMNSQEKLGVYASNGNLTFTAFGSEVS